MAVIDRLTRTARFLFSPPRNKTLTASTRSSNNPAIDAMVNKESFSIKPFALLHSYSGLHAAERSKGEPRRGGSMAELPGFHSRCVTTGEDGLQHRLGTGFLSSLNLRGSALRLQILQMTARYVV